MTNGTNAIVRQLKIDMITDTPNPIVLWFDEVWRIKLKENVNVHYNDDTEAIYRSKHNDNILSYHDIKKCRYSVNFGYFSIILRDCFDVDREYSKEVISLLMENVLSENESFEFLSRMAINEISRKISKRIEIRSLLESWVKVE